jgi:E3 ubiquitin-protein ligase BRE1
MEREEQLKKINSLVLNGNQNDSKALTEQEVKQTDLYAEITAKLSTSERHTQAAEEKLNKLKQEWAQALADAEAARAAMEEMQAKHLKRWKDIVDENPDIPAENGEPLGDKKGEEIIRLKHKLTQAIENVRQADTTRKTLEEAVTMNQSLQAKLEEIKGKYTALQASRVSSSSHANNHISSSTPPVTGGLSTPKQKHSSSGSSSSQSAEKIDKSDKDMVKLHRDYRKVRKELAAAIASKETAKAKLSINERERESLNQTNYRLLKQAAERDDVNAKSLSTILHLKQLTEQITKEKENLEQQAKSSQQVALAARLAANARERVSEEFEKQRKELESRANNLERKCAEAAKGKELLEGRMSQQKARMSSLLKDADKAKKRCDELASESTTLQEDKQKMMESLAVAKREAIEASKVSESLTKQASATVKGGVPSGFTVDQLNTQVTVLKSRLMCAVCNHRDKKCILLRCRHMFCKNCVDENIKNRSRKCPACGTRFDTKDVADVWL